LTKLKLEGSESSPLKQKENGMHKFNKILVLALVVLFAVSAPVFAQSRYGVQSSGLLTGKNNLVFSAGTWVYGWKIYASSASSISTLYDAVALDTDIAETEYIIDELGEATQYDSVEVWFPKPIRFARGVSVRCITGAAVVFVGPPPSK